MIDEGIFPAYLSSVKDYSPEVLSRIVPNSTHVEYLTRLFSGISGCKWAQELNRLHLPAPLKGAKLPEMRTQKSRRSDAYDEDLEDEEPAEPNTHDKDKLWSGLEYEMACKTKGRSHYTNGVLSCDSSMSPVSVVLGEFWSACR